MNTVSLKREGYVDIITLNRPPINALDIDALDVIYAVVESAVADPESRAIVFASGIKEIFCSGGDLKFWKNIENGRLVSRAGSRVFSLIERSPKPTIAAINGHVIGDGISLALACDLRIASDKAAFRMPEASYGFIPGWGSVRRLIDIAGRGNASGILLTGRQIVVERALMIGLVNEIVPAENLLELTLQAAGAIAEMSPASLRAIKCALLGGNERVCFENVWGREDWKEGISALMQKRDPEFSSSKQITDCCSFFGNRFQQK